ncbi:alpha/beta hydrolase [Microbacterium sp. RD1]|uniref:alpha/beta hydrolase n=1 Tax=Microbacterium sp. RD1 TaxID=3457313 RepID=UPI003FA5BC22
MPGTRPLYRDFTSVDELNRAYDIEATVPDFGAYANDFVARSAAYRDEARCVLDVRFGPTLEETYDIFLPESDTVGESRPALFFIHGGYWKATTSKVWSYVARGLAARGFVVAVENYALCPNVTVAEIARQHRAAYAHFFAHATDYGVDRDRIVVAGHSAGGHAVTTLLETDWSNDYGLPPMPYAGAVPVSGVFDLRPLVHTFLNADLRLDEASAEGLSILTVPPALPPIVVAYGTNETAEFERQSVDFAAMVSAAGHAVDVVAMDNNHFDILESLADGAGTLARAVERLART